MNTDKLTEKESPKNNENLGDIIVEKHSLGAKIDFVQVTYDSLEIREEIEGLLENINSVFLPTKYSYQIQYSSFWGKVAKIVLKSNEEKVLEKGQRIKFISNIIERACDEHPEFILAKNGEGGTIEDHQEGDIYHVYWDGWPKSYFTANYKSEFIIEPQSN